MEGACEVRQPKNITYRAEYEPDMARMVRALRVLLEYNPQKPEEENNHGKDMQGREVSESTANV